MLCSFGLPASSVADGNQSVIAGDGPHLSYGQANSSGFHDSSLVVGSSSVSYGVSSYDDSEKAFSYGVNASGSPPFYSLMMIMFLRMGIGSSEGV